MRTSSRFALAGVLIIVLVGFAVLAGRLYQQREREQPAPARNNEEVSVTSAADRGPGSLREALFVAAASKGKLNVVIRVPTITLETALPPLTSSRGISIRCHGSGSRHRRAGD